MCLQYEFNPKGDGMHEVYLRHPGGRQFITVTDNPAKYPQSIPKEPTRWHTINRVAEMFPKYHGPVLRVIAGEIVAGPMRWGFIPPWADRPIHNAQREKLAVSSTWKQSFQSRRCLVPATAFYDWQATPGARRKTKLRIRPTDQEVFCFAGIWNTFKGEDGNPVDCYTIVTSPPNEFMSPIRDRMPVILTPESQARWTDDRNTTGEGLDALLNPYAGPMAAEPA